MLPIISLTAFRILWVRLSLGKKRIYLLFKDRFHIRSKISSLRLGVIRASFVFGLIFGAVCDIIVVDKSKEVNKMLEKLIPTDFDKVYALMEKSFPPDEHRPYDGQKALLDNPLYNIYVLPDGGDIKAFITLWQFEKLIFIEHFAVNPDYRNSGTGSRILQEIKSSFPCMICLEAELPDNELAQRRICFYERNGFCANDFPYVQPIYSEGQNPLPLVIMTSGRKITENEFDEIKNLLYRNVYNVK